MSKGILEFPVNSVSFGYCGFNILNELYNRGYDNFLLRDIGQPSLDCFDKRRGDKDFINWLNERRSNFLSNYSKKFNSIKLWHTNGSEGSVSNNESLFSFFELDSVTPVEVNILNQKKNVIVTSQYAKGVLERCGVEVPVIVVPIGLDPLHLYKTDDRKKIPAGITSWSVFGKIEVRKSTMEVVKTWIKTYGNNPKHLLNVHCYNVHFSPEDNQKLVAQILEGKAKPFNVNFYPYVGTLFELNQAYNYTDIVIDMSKGEGFSLPSHSCVALGKHAVIHNNSGMTEWATKENAVLIDPTGKAPAFDGVFFRNTGDFSIGNWFTYDENDLIKAMSQAEARYKQNPVNEAGLKLPEKFNWKICVDKLVEILES
jgi:hypothetical protein